MKPTFLNRSYMLLAGVAVAMVALVFYMWIDARRLEQSLLPKAKQAPEVSGSNIAQTGDTSLSGRETQTAKWQPAPQQYNTEANETARIRRYTPASGRTHDYMFEKGENVEGTKENKPINSGSAPSF